MYLTSVSFTGKMAGICANMSDLLRAMANKVSYETDWLYNWLAMTSSFLAVFTISPEFL